VLTPEERERGVVLLDIGGGTTDIVAFRRGRIRFSKVIPIGGWQFTNDIVVAFNTSFEAAEAAKLNYGTADLQGIEFEEQVSLPVAERDIELQVPRMELCQLVRERAQELARLVAISLNDADLDIGDEPNIVLTGGASSLPGLASVIERSLGMPVREGAPSPKGGDPQEIQELSDPAFATAVGILTWAATEYSPSSNGSKNGHSNGFKNTVESEPRGGFLGTLRVLFSRRNGKGRN
jgi:cell division protein FtsA